MGITVNCPRCCRPMTVNESTLGTVVLCPRCKQRLRVNKPGVTPEQTRRPSLPVPASAADRPKRSIGARIGIAVVAILLASFAAVVGKVAMRNLLRSLSAGKVSGYERYEDPLHTFSTDLPGGLEVREKRLSVPTPGGTGIDVRTYQATAANYGLTVGVYEMRVDEWRRGRTDIKVADDTLASAFAGMGASVKRYSDVNLDGRVVRHAFGSGYREGQHFHVAAEVHIRPERTFLLQVVGTTEGALTSPVAERFFESFRAK